MATRLRRVCLGRAAMHESPLDLQFMCEAAGVSAREHPLSARSGGLQALLTPTENDCFRVLVDPTPRGGWWPSEPVHLRETARRHRMRFRIAHELAHTLFFWRRRSERPRRHLLDTPAQERFCDNFARALLVPPQAAAGLPVHPSSALRLQESFDISLEVAARALAAAHPRGVIGIWFASPEDPDRLQLQWGSYGLSHRPNNWEATAPRAWLPERRQLLLCAP